MSKNNCRFLLARLHTDSIARQSTPKKIRQALDNLSTNFTDTYRKTLDQVDKQHEDGKMLAYQVFSWVTYAQRPLKIIELQHALAVSDKGEVDPEDLEDEETIMSVCAGLVTVSSETCLVGLVRE